MIRRNFLKGIFASALSAPVLAKEITKPEQVEPEVKPELREVSCIISRGQISYNKNMWISLRYDYWEDKDLIEKIVIPETGIYQLMTDSCIQVNYVIDTEIERKLSLEFFDVSTSLHSLTKDDVLVFNGKTPTFTLFKLKTS